MRTSAFAAPQLRPDASLLIQVCGLPSRSRPQRRLPLQPPSTRGDRGVLAGDAPKLPPRIGEEVSPADVLDVLPRRGREHDRSGLRRVCASANRLLRGLMDAQRIEVRLPPSVNEAHCVVIRHGIAQAVLHRCLDFGVSGLCCAPGKSSRRIDATCPLQRPRLRHRGCSWALVDPGPLACGKGNLPCLHRDGQGRRLANPVDPLTENPCHPAPDHSGCVDTVTIPVADDRHIGRQAERHRDDGCVRCVSEGNVNALAHLG